MSFLMHKGVKGMKWGQHLPGVVTEQSLQRDYFARASAAYEQARKDAAAAKKKQKASKHVDKHRNKKASDASEETKNKGAAAVSGAASSYIAPSQNGMYSYRNTSPKGSSGGSRSSGSITSKYNFGVQKRIQGRR